MTKPPCEIHRNVTVDRVIEDMERDDNAGICLSCGAEAGGIEPDGRGITCEVCGESYVYGAEELIIQEWYLDGRDD